MKLTDIELVRTNWLRASKELNFKIETPYKILLNGVIKEVFAFLPEYGSDNGIIVELMYAPDYETNKDVFKWANEQNCFCSFVAMEGFYEYDKEYFIDMLEDWGKFR